MAISKAIIITTTLKDKNNLKKLILSIAGQSLLPEQIILIYDGSGDFDSSITGQYPLAIRLLANPKKLSLTLLQNKALGLCQEDCVLLLNDDVSLDGNFIEELIGVLEKNKDIGIVTGKLLRQDGEKLDSTGQFLGKSRKPVERGFGVRDRGQYEQPGFVFGACGAAVLYRKKMLEDIAIAPGEYFDNDYHMFYEDLDISWRARNFGWKAYYNPKAVAYHQRGATAKEKKPLIRFFESYNFAWLNTRLKSDLIKNRYMTIIKNDCLREFLKDLPFIFIYDLKIFLYCLVFAPKVIFNSLRNMPFLLLAFKKRKLLEDKMRKIK
ncbi:MAG: glycosyltransferase [Candidatus Omnitrophica bacterium]|nr:glycosyltransferase [Candidatus Omnitrophota bacterium]